MDFKYDRQVKYFAIVARLLIVGIAVTSFVCIADAQDVCVSSERIAILLADVKSEKVQQPNIALKDEIHAMKSALLTQTAQ